MSQRDKRPKDRSKQSDGWNRDPCDPHMRGRDETAGRLLLDGRRSDPVQEPEEDGQATEDRTEILEEFVPVHYSHDRKGDGLREEGQVMRRPMTGVRERIPQEMGESPDKNGHQHECQLQRMPERDGIRFAGNSLPNGAGHQCGQWLFDNCMEEPEDDESHRQTKKEQPTSRVPERTFGREPKEEF